MVAVWSALMSAQGIAGAEAIIKIDGSNTMHSVTEAGVERFRASRKEPIRITVGVSGTGGGFAKFCRGEIDIVNASRPIQRKEMKACNKAGVEYVELPMAFDALTVVVIIVDLSEKTDDFAKTGLSFKTIIIQYYFGFIPRIDAMLFPLFIFISVI